MEFNLDHIHFRCQDLEASLDFYAKMFGGEIVARLELPHTTLVRMKIGETFLAFSPKKEGMDVQELSGQERWGMYELGFFVADTYQAVEELKAKGAEFLQDAYEIRPGVQVAFMKAPDGVKIEIIHRD